MDYRTRRRIRSIVDTDARISALNSMTRPSCGARSRVHGTDDLEVWLNQNQAVN